MSVRPPVAPGSREQIVDEVCELLDAALVDRVLVFGSPPPRGRDLDLLVRPAEERACREALRLAGLAERGRRFARLTCLVAYEVELQPAGELGLPDGEIAALFAEALPLPGLAQLCEPAPYHRLLLLANVVLDDPARLDPKRRRRVQRALDQDPSAWQLADEHAGAWPDPSALARLRRGFERGSSPPRPPGRLRRRLPPRSGRLVALSGIDGSGKTFQAQSLKAILEQLGHEAVVEWVPLASNQSLDWLGGPLKRVLRRLPGLMSPRLPDGADRGAAPNPGSILRQRSAAANQLWTAVVALLNGLSHLRRAAPHLLLGRIVIFDRYVLDSIVRLRFSYGEQARFPLQRLVIKAFSPRPACAFFLDVPAATALARKQDRWRPEDLDSHVGLYRAEYGREGVQRLDGERPPEALCAEIAEAVWRALP
jgi:thymidylate kinase